MITETDTALAHARKALDTARACLAAEIAAYPTPISGCDAQFNHLLSQRSQISRAIAALEHDVFIPTPRTPAPFAGVESR
jgi:chorismate mutase